MPDGRVNYTGSASTFFYAGDVLTAGSRPVEIKFERYIVQGTVVDESGIAIDGAAVQVGGATVFTDSRGRFFVRLSSNRTAPVRVLFDEFLATGRFEAVSVPETARPVVERESVPVRIIVRRIPPDRVSSGSAAASAGRVAVPND
jgi:hypothetical protein